MLRKKIASEMLREMSESNKKKVALHLYGLSDGSITPRDVTTGICHELDASMPYDFGTTSTGYMIGGTVCFVAYVSLHWDKFSGQYGYPIPDPEGEEPEHKVYYRTDDKWDIDTQYGRDRRELCVFIADCLMGKVEL